MSKARNASAWTGVLGLLLGATIAGVTVEAATAGEKIEMKLRAVAVSTGSTAFLKEFKRRIEKNTKRKITARIVSNAEPRGWWDILSTTQSENGELNLVPSAYLTGFFPASAPAVAPGLFRNKDHANRVLHTEAVFGQFRKAAEPKGIVPISLYVNGPVTIFSSKRIRTVEDMKGLKFRTMPSTIESLIVPAFNATAVPDPFGDTSPPDKNTVLDGAATPFGAAVAMTWYKVAPIAVTSEVAYAFTLAFVPKKWLDGLGEDLQTVVKGTGAEMNKWAVSMSPRWQYEATHKWSESGGSVFALPYPSQDDLKRMSNSYLSGLKKFSHNDETGISVMYDTIKSAARQTGG